MFSYYDPCDFLKYVKNQENIFYNTYITKLMFIRTLLIHSPFGKLSSITVKLNEFQIMQLAL